MKKTIYIKALLISLLVITPLCLFVSRTQSQSLASKPAATVNGLTRVDFDSDRWVIDDKKARKEDYLGRKSLYLTSGYAYLKDLTMEDGVIEVDIAAPKTRAFIGIVFRFESADEHELFYLRPHKSGLDDAAQYTPSFKGSAPWQLYSGKGFTHAIDISKEEWMRVRIVVSGLTGKVYVGDMDKPVLVIEDFKRGYSKGSLGLWATATGGHFSNFSYRAEQPAAKAPISHPAPASGTLTKWEISEAFDTDKRDPHTLPTSAELKAMKWERVGVEPPGMVVLDRYRRSPGILPPFSVDTSTRTEKQEGTKVVFARAVIDSDRDQIKKMKIGYSDEVTVFLNSQPIFTGRSAFRFRDPGFLGIMDVENDAVYLPLKKGRNELLLAVSEYFGGWGFICRLQDTDAVTID